MFNIPLIQLCREVILEPPNVRLYTRSIWILLRRVYRILVAQRGQASEIPEIFRQLECLLRESVPSY